MANSGFRKTTGQADRSNPKTKSRQRQWAPKVKTGCAQCRARHIKCDESKPSCRRCAVSRLACDFRTSSPTLRLVPGMAVSVSPLPVRPTAEECELNHLFRTRLTLSFADEFNQDLWNVHIPLASQSQVPIWHASLAFAALWRYQMAKTGSDALFRQQMYQESLHQYSSTINCVVQLTRKPHLSAADKTSVLVANLLFLRWSMNQGDSKSATAIISSSVQLVHHWGIWDSNSAASPIPTNLIVLFFSKLGRFLHQSLLTSGHSPWQWEKGLAALQPRPFVSCTDACLELEMLWTGVRAVIEELPVRPSAKQLTRACDQQSRFRSAMSTWDAKFETLRKKACTSRSNRTRLAVLLVRQKLIHIILGVDIDRLETSWDAFHEDFERATLLAESVLVSGPDSRGKTIFAPMLAKSLHFMARVCRHPRLRRRIVDLLRPQLSMVRLLSSEQDYSPTQIQETIIAVEENGWAMMKLGRPECNCSFECVPDKYICGHHRVVTVDVHLRPGKASELCLRTRADIVHNRPGHIVFVAAPIIL
ncbi:Zn(2)-C6 fungal-type DNA-binding domain-containing protein [Cordyceps javanica]|uniref:Zn(2)-C6 fungal-type DNA-binding domain-containing protein n=1 Tax=Cordyceps javanica TaxID=43265 RepID=A0A545WC01_9HYPO|nr:Zn(2)-C6 fungal-type DNA-binding domain-containing protein [Cordyceps javanica]TQW11405.1 Zn(2)-C6 fungal-type DNA-binding domain protein [Cordyceps javanica]